MLAYARERGGYAPSGIFAIAVVAALAIYGFRTTLEGRPVFKGLLDS